MESPSQPPPESSSLRSRLRERRVLGLLADAEFIRDHPDSPERTAEAERFVRETMLQFTMGAITDEERARIHELLAFAIPPLPEYLAHGDSAE